MLAISDADAPDDPVWIGGAWAIMSEAGGFALDTELAGSCGYSVCHMGEIHDLVFTPPCEDPVAIAPGESGQAGGYQITALQAFVGPYCEGPPTVRHHWVMQRL